MASASCTIAAATDRYQMVLSWKPGNLDSATAGTVINRMRTADATSDGTVLPIAWNMPDATKISPDATKFHDTIRIYPTPTASTAGSFVKIPTSAAGAMCAAIANSTMTAAAMSDASLNVAFTRSGS